MVGQNYVRFPIPEPVGRREWGTEDLLCLVPGKYTLKKLFISKGSQGGLQYHRKKDEAGILISGVLEIDYENEKGEIVTKRIEEGAIFHFPPLSVHRERAVTDCIIIEVSNPVFNDRVRCEDMFGESVKGGLPTTDESQIVLK